MLRSSRLLNSAEEPMNNKKNTTSIPTRRRIGQADVTIAAKLLTDSLLAGWGLQNSSKIAREMVRLLRAESKRRKERG